MNSINRSVEKLSRTKGIDKRINRASNLFTLKLVRGKIKIHKQARIFLTIINLRKFIIRQEITVSKTVSITDLSLTLLGVYFSNNKVKTEYCLQSSKRQKRFIIRIILILQIKKTKHPHTQSHYCPMK